MPSWYSLPGYGFGFVAIVAILLRDRRLAMTAALLVADTIVCDGLAAHIPADCLWAYEAISDLATATALVWSMRAMGIIIGTMLGANVSFYLVIGAAQAFGSLYDKALISYHAWWAMDYLAFAMLGALIFGGWADHGGKRFWRRVADLGRSPRRHVLESRHSDSAVSSHAETVTAMFAALAKLYRIER